MGISFHCESCKKKITAPDNAGGKWGKCPYCSHKCYVPMPKTDDEEELKLAPIDEEEEKKYEKMMRETRNITGVLLHQKEMPPEQTTPIATSEDKQLTGQIIKYLRQMADGQLDEAQKTADEIVPYKAKAKKILENIILAEKPQPELANVPKKVLVGFVRNILTRMG
jgi:DNA-directed RNA polymerase subunit RPC12/RpoP